MKLSLIPALAAAGGLALAGCTATVDAPNATATVSTEPPGTFVPANEFVAVTRAGRPNVVYGDTRGYWTYGPRNRMYYVSGGTRYEGNWYVRGNRYCVNYRGIPDRCYRVYRTAPDRYAFYTEDNQVWARVSF